MVGRGRIARYFGVLAILIPMVVYMYYVYIEAWCLRYAWEYLIGGVTLTGSIEEKVRGAAVFFGQTTGTRHQWRVEHELGLLAHRGRA